MMAPPPGGDMMAPPPGDTMAPPPADNLFPEPAAEAPKEESHSGGKVTSYEVAKHDSLWKIAAKKKIYADPFQWPILFIANREKIKDPDMIRPGQDLKVNRSSTSDEVSNAVQKAKDTPRYEPHTAPRKKLPIDY
jgi:nucleoid-associated protein YgaU